MDPVDPLEASPAAAIDRAGQPAPGAPPEESLTTGLARVAHELRTPIASLVSAADTSRLGLERLGRALDTPAGQRLLAAEPELARVVRVLGEAAGLTQAAARRLVAMTSRLGELAEPGAGPFEPLDLNQAVDAALELLQPELGGRVRIERDYGRLPPVPCRPQQIDRLLINLLANAAQAIQAGGRPGEIRIRTWCEGQAACLRISDNGIGISPETAGRLFEPGFTTRARGAGLGLSIVRQILDRHGGRISLDSHPGPGASFTVSLPLADSRRDAP